MPSDWALLAKAWWFNHHPRKEVRGVEENTKITPSAELVAELVRRGDAELDAQKFAYTIEEFSGLSYPRVVRMSFELPRLDWCRFERSDLYRNLTAYLEGLQKQEIRIQQLVEED